MSLRVHSQRPLNFPSINYENTYTHTQMYTYMCVLSVIVVRLRLLSLSMYRCVLTNLDKIIDVNLKILNQSLRIFIFSRPKGDGS